MDIDNLIIKAQNGDDESMDEIIKTYFPLVSTNAKKFFLVGAETEDLIQEGLLGLFKAIKAYMPQKSSFKTFANLCVKRQIFSAIKTANSQKNYPLNEAILNFNNYNKKDDNLDDNFFSFDISPENIFFNKEKLQNFKEYTEKNFSNLEKQVFEYLIRGYTYKEIAKQLKTATKSIDNAIQRIKKKSESWMKKYNLNNL